MANDLWRTPPQVFRALNKEFDFIADMACSSENKLCELGFTESDDSLSFNWSNDISRKQRSYVWCNPPYSDPSPWIEKALEAQIGGLGVVMLLNQDTSVGWFLNALNGVSETRYITGYLKGNGKAASGRLDFLDLNGNPAKGNNKAQFILVFNPFKIGARESTYITKEELMKAGE